MLSASLWMILATGFLNLSMVLFHRQMSSLLGISYAELSALIGLTNLFGVLTAGLSTYLTKIFSRDAALVGSGAVKFRLLKLAKGMIFALLAFIGLLLALGPWIVSYLRLPSFWLYTAVVGMVASGALLGILRSALQGLHRFHGLGASLMLEGGGRVGFAILLAGGMGWGLAGALWGSLLGSFAGLLTCFISLGRLGPTRRCPPEAEGRRAWRHRATELGRDTVALGLFSLLCFLDVFIFKHYHSEAETAFYSRAALVGKAFLYAPAAFNMVLLPLVAASKARQQDPRGILLKFLGSMAALEGAGLALVWFFTPFIVTLLCGGNADIAGLVPVVRWFCLCVIPLALYQLTLLYQLAHHQGGVLVLEGAVVLAYGFSLTLFHGDPRQVMTCLGGAASLALVGGLIFSLRVPTSLPEPGLARAGS